jgi:hypothetical protein
MGMGLRARTREPRRWAGPGGDGCCLLLCATLQLPMARAQPADGRPAPGSARFRAACTGFSSRRLLPAGRRLWLLLLLLLLLLLPPLLLLLLLLLSPLLLLVARRLRRCRLPRLPRRRHRHVAAAHADDARAAGRGAAAGGAQAAVAALYPRLVRQLAVRVSHHGVGIPAQTLRHGGGGGGAAVRRDGGGGAFAGARGALIAPAGGLGRARSRLRRA